MQPLRVDRTSVEAFLRWVPTQSLRFELVDGEVVAMAGAGRRHNAIVVNLTALIHAKVRAGPCQTFTSDTYIKTSRTSRRMADLGVDCGQPTADSLEADEPVLLIEVLSPSTGGFDVTVKLAEYQALPSVQTVIFFDTEAPAAHLYRRSEAGWHDEVLRQPDAVISIEPLGVSIELSDAYDGITFPDRPRLVEAGATD